VIERTRCAQRTRSAPTLAPTAESGAVIDIFEGFQERDIEADEVGESVFERVLGRPADTFEGVGDSGDRRKPTSQ